MAIFHTGQGRQLREKEAKTLNTQRVQRTIQRPILVPEKELVHDRGLPFHEQTGM